jgi:hypothetical protein
MKDGVHACAGLRCALRIAQVALDELKLPFDGREILALAGFEVIEAANLFSPLDERLRKPGADKTGTAGD